MVLFDRLKSDFDADCLSVTYTIFCYIYTICCTQVIVISVKRKSFVKKKKKKPNHIWSVSGIHFYKKPRKISFFFHCCHYNWYGCYSYCIFHRQSQYCCRCQYICCCQYSFHYSNLFLIKSKKVGTMRDTETILLTVIIIHKKYTAGLYLGEWNVNASKVY